MERTAADLSRESPRTNKEDVRESSSRPALLLLLLILFFVFWWNSAAIEQFRGRGRKGRKGRFVPSSGATVLGCSRPAKGWILSDRTQAGPSFSGRPLLLSFSFRRLPSSLSLSVSPAKRAFSLPRKRYPFPPRRRNRAVASIRTP